MDDNVKFTIECEMRQRWVNDFCSMLKYMESCGSAGHSAVIAFYSDGDGDFRPKFNINTEFEKQKGYHREDRNCPLPVPEVMYDAG